MKTLFKVDSLHALKMQAAAFGGGWVFLHHGMEFLVCDRGEKSLQVADP
jgi:hypothetical protein